VAHADRLPFWDHSKDVVISGCCILHVEDWRKAVSEATRVSRSWVLFTRTPISKTRPTALFSKTAYDVPCLEWRFAEEDVLRAFREARLTLHAEKAIFGNDEYAHVSYLLRKESA
jgi:ubiquinone/menaquinone biosynthesis C-methylase UbiE